MNKQFSLLPVVTVNTKGVVVACSVDVASYFEKKHPHVLRTLRELFLDAGLIEEGHFSPGGRSISGSSSDIENATFLASQFYKGTYRNTQNKEQPCFYMTAIGFQALAIRLKGERAFTFQLAYIRAFNAMAERLARMNDAETLARGRMEAATRLAGSRAALADAALALMDEGLTQRQAAELLHVSRHVVYRLKKRFGFLTSGLVEVAA